MSKKKPTRDPAPRSVEIVLRHDGRDRMVTASLPLPTQLRVPVLMEGGFGIRTYSRTGACDERGRPIYGDPQ